MNFNRFNSLIELVSYFNSDAVCRNFIKEQRWGNTVVCPYCGSLHCYTCKDGKVTVKLPRGLKNEPVALKFNIKK